jgi:hypothetical protein
MRGLLTEDGDLVIIRGGREINSACPFNGSPCGEWCPHMTEPIRQFNKKLQREETILHLCHNKHWKFTEFEDRRQP